MKRRLLSGVIAGLVLLTGCSTGAKPGNSTNEASKNPPIPATLPQPASYWPTDGWKTCLPEQEGMKSAPLAQMFEDIKSQTLPVDGLVVIRNGYIVAENYYGGENKTTAHPIHSITKNFTSVLVGIAIQEGEIKSVNDHVMDYFTDKHIKNMDNSKKDITIDQCLTMRAGLDWHELNTDGSNNDDWMNNTFYDSKDPLQAVLDRPVNKNEVNRFNYSTGLPELFSAILQNKNNGELLSQYANDKLFKPLGITSADWPSDVSGESYGGTAMSMTVRDVAKLGYLYLNNGNWDGTQLVPESWVKTSTTSHTDTIYKDVGYGYYWWTFDVNGHHLYEGMGSGGQYLAVVPDLNLVVVLTSNGQRVAPFLENYIIPAIESSGAIPEDTSGDAKLKSLTSQNS